MKVESGCESYRAWSRRSVLRGAAGGAAALLFGPSALAQLALKKEPDGRDALVVLFLRGGADGLNLVVPYREDAYFKLRPSLSLDAPNGSTAADRVLDLDGVFGFHPALAGIEPLFKEGKLAAIQAVGSGDGTRSHFEAMSAMERGLNAMGPGASRSNGWLARYLNATAHEDDSPLRAIAISDLMPDTLRGAPGCTNIGSIADYRLTGPEPYRHAIEKAYASGDDAMSAAGREMLHALRTLDRLDYRSYRPAGAYPTTDLGQGLKQVAFLIKAGVGLEVAFLDKGGWDTHFAQGGSTGLHAGLTKDLGDSLRAFSDDLDTTMGRTTVVVMTEFGRRAYENSTLGTDHGRASVMFVMGGGVRGGKVHGRWPGLSEKDLEGPGDLQVTTDYRSVLAEVLRKRMGLGDVGPVFPGFVPAELGVVG